MGQPGREAKWIRVKVPHTVSLAPGSSSSGGGGCCCGEVTQHRRRSGRSDQRSQACGLSSARGRQSPDAPQPPRAESLPSLSPSDHSSCQSQEQRGNIHFWLARVPAAPGDWLLLCGHFPPIALEDSPRPNKCHRQWLVTGESPEGQQELTSPMPH